MQDSTGVLPQGEGACCAHNTVVRATVQADQGTVRDLWRCRDCDCEFAPFCATTREMLRDMIKANDSARDQLRRLGLNV